MTYNEFLTIITNFNNLSKAIGKYFVNQKESDDGNFVGDIDIYDTTIEVVIENWKNPDWSERRTCTIENFLAYYNTK